MSRLDASSTATAHRFWEQEWQRAEGRAAWSDAEPVVLDCIRSMVAKNRLRALDVGCGIGRHTLAMASAGMQATGLDASPAGLGELALEAKARDLAIATVEGSIHDLPFADESFDYVLSFNVIYHGMRGEVERAISEIARLLPSGGVFQGTLLSRRNAAYGKGTEIEPGVFVMPHEEGSDKHHPHFYCDAADLVSLLGAFEILALQDVEQRKAGSWHWSFVAEKK